MEPADTTAAEYELRYEKLDPELLPTIQPTPRSEACLVLPVLEAIQAAFLNQDIGAASVFAGWICPRRDENLVAPFGASHRPADGNDVYLQLGIRVPGYGSGRASDSVIDAIHAVEDSCVDQQHQDAQACLVEARARVEAAQKAEASVQAELDRLTNTRTRRAES